MPAGREGFLGVDAHLRGADRLVDLGCGDGSWLDQHPATEAIGIDITEAPERPSSDRTWTFISADLDEGIALKDGWADAVRANQVIEHIRNAVRFLNEVHRIPSAKWRLRGHDAEHPVRQASRQARTPWRGADDIWRRQAHGGELG